MIKWLFRWMFADEILEEYMRGWNAGVIQHMHEPSSCKPIEWIRESWPTYEQYMYGDQ